MARPRSEAARTKIIESATELALDVGIRAFTIGEVAKRSGVAKTTIYRHFPSKNALIITALDGVTPTPQVPDTGTFHDDLVAFLHEILPIFAAPELRALFLDVLAVASFDPELHALQKSMMDGRGQALATLVQRAIERGELPDDLSLDTAFEVIEGPLVMRGLVNPEQLDGLDVGALVKTMIARLHA